MSNLIDRKELLKIFAEHYNMLPFSWHIRESYDSFLNKILSLPLQQWGNEKIKELIEKKIEGEIWAFSDYTIPILKELLTEIESL